MLRFRVAIAGIVIALCAAVACDAGSATPLDRFLEGLASLQTDFVQQTLNASGRKLESGKGQLVVQRPGQFRWEYKANGSAADGGQLLVADGRNLWFYERDLSQVTVRDAREALSATPITLLSGSSTDVQLAFAVSQLPDRDGLEWVAIVPRNSAGDFSRAEIGFRGRVLMAMEVTDKLGQQVQMSFSHTLRNKRVPAAMLTFKVPAGVDQIGVAR